MPPRTLALLSKHKQTQRQRWQRAAEGRYPEELSVDADPLKQNRDNEMIRPKLVLGVLV